MCSPCRPRKPATSSNISPQRRTSCRPSALLGWGYMALGQSSTTLSSGEAQRVKLAAELMRTGTGERSVIILDEPTTGLHLSDVTHLYRVLRRLADRGDAVVVIEHHLELLAACDQLVELGPTGGEHGGVVIASGTPEELMANPDSITGPWLAIRRDTLQGEPSENEDGGTKGGGGSASKESGGRADEHDARQPADRSERSNADAAHRALGRG